MHQTIKEYSNGATSCTITQEPLSLSDLPTLTVCWYKKYFNQNTSKDEFKSNVYGENVSIDLRTFGQKKNTVSLLENKNVLVSDGLYIHLSKLHLNGSINCVVFGNDIDLPISKHLQCFKITPKYNGQKKGDIKQFVMQLVLKFKPETVTYYLNPEKRVHSTHAKIYYFYRLTHPGSLMIMFGTFWDPLTLRTQLLVTE